MTVWRSQSKNYVETPVKLIMIRNPEDKSIRFAFSNIMDTDLTTIAKMQANRYWIERNFEDVKGLCDIDSFMGRSWISWHHHIALVILAFVFLLKIQMSFLKKKIIISLNQVVSIILYKNPLRVLSADELAESINYVNEIRARMWFGKMKKFIKQRYENTIEWTKNLIENRNDLII